MITPTVGRVVWFWPSKEDRSICSGGEQPLPAIVCHVWSDSCVNLAGFDANGVSFSRASVPLHQEGNPRPDAFFAEWMPYQKGQAAKTEQLEKAAAAAPGQ